MYYKTSQVNNIKVGMGYDIHRLEESRKLMLGGVHIPYSSGLSGHSDADVLIHAIIDAILGALASGDIGKYFPPDDPRYKDIDSKELLKKVSALMRQSEYAIVNIDTIIIAEKPKLLPYIDEMRSAIASVLEIDLESVSIKAKTNEGCGEIGEGKAIAAHAVVLIKKEEPKTRGTFFSKI